MSSLTISINSLNIKIDEKNLTAEIVSSPHVKGSILIPRSIIKNGREYLITHIGKCSFKDNSTIEKISFPPDTEICTIENEAFNCSSIQSLIIPSSLSELEEEWCRGASKLINISVSPGNKRYKYVDNKFLILDDNNSILFVRRDINSIIIPTNIKHIGPFSFSECKAIQTIIFPPQLETISKSSFKESSLETITIPSNVTQIQESAFYHCSNLRSINFEENSKINEIEDNVFSQTAIEAISIPSSVTQIGKFAFYGCSNLKSINFEKDSKLNFIDKSAFSDSSLEVISIPSSVTEIGECVFYSCNLKNINFEQNSKLEVIRSSAFSWSQIEAILIPSRVNQIEESAFSSCMELRCIEFLSDHLKIDENCFYESENLFLVSFPNAIKINLSIDSFSNVSSSFHFFVRNCATIDFI